MNEFIDMRVTDLRALEVGDILRDKIGNGLLTGMLSEAVYCVDVLMLRENRAFEYACELVNITPAQYAAVKAKISEKSNNDEEGEEIERRSGQRLKDAARLYGLIAQLAGEAGHDYEWLMQQMPEVFWHGFTCCVKDKDLIESARREKERKKRDFDALYKLINDLFIESGRQKIWLTNRLPSMFANAYYAYVHSLQDKADTRCAK